MPCDHPVYSLRAAIYMIVHRIKEEEVVRVMNKGTPMKLPPQYSHMGQVKHLYDTGLLVRFTSQRTGLLGRRVCVVVEIKRMGNS